MTQIKVENLRLKYAGDEMLFHDVSFSCKHGEKILFLGPSGCGKSTLLQVISGLIPTVMEVPMRADNIITPESWGYVFQDPDSQFCMPYVDEELAFVLENLAVPREKMDCKINYLLNEVGLELPHPHTKINELSGGMKQRLAIASVLAMEPDVLFLDEPTALLDPEGTKEVWDTIKRVGEEKTVIIVEHKLNYLLDWVERVVVFDDKGTIIADGATLEVFSQYKEKLKEYGIWYPGVWEEVIDPTNLNQNPEKGESIISLHDFQGFRGKECKISVEDVTFHKGQWTTIIGKNGAGKSTLLEAIRKLLKTKGELHYFGENYEEEVTFVFQNPEFQFVTHSVEEEIGYTLLRKGVSEVERNNKVEKLLDNFHLTHVRKKHPFELSTGQKRRLSVASAVVHRPSVLLLDEPTFGQDSRNTFSMLEWLQQLKEEGGCVVMVTHDEHIVEHFADKVLVVESGEVVEVIEKERYVHDAMVITS
ncbi:ABC transporter ATP-binding protein [Sutcliffiella cohnii]